MIFMFAENHKHARYWAGVNEIDPSKIKIIDRPRDMDGLDTCPVLLYHTFWRRRDAQMLYDYARARRLVVVNVPEKSWSD